MLSPYLIIGLGAALLSALGGRRRPKGKAKAGVIQWVPIMQEAHAKYPNVPISVACAIMENESGGNFDAVRWECKSLKTGKLYGQKTECKNGDQRMDKQGRPVMSTGAWQFIISTGEGFGLKSTVNASADERRDPRKATMAAFKFLSGLYKKWGKKGEKYAISAYNAGNGGVENAYPNLPGGGKYYKHISEKREKYRYLD